MVCSACTGNPSTLEAEAAGFQRVRGQPGVILFQNSQINLKLWVEEGHFFKLLGCTV